MKSIDRKYLGTFSRTDAEDPLKVWRFQVEIEGFGRLGFSKISGLEGQTDVVEYREGGQNATVQKSPGLTKWPDLTLERGQVLGVGVDDFLLWYTQVHDASAKKPKSSKVFRRDIDIVQFDKEGAEVRRWRVTEAWPSQWKPISDLDGSASDNSFESLTIVHEGCYLLASTGS